jgi:glycosyltransferase involved in cell wall biosynthesis
VRIVQVLGWYYPENLGGTEVYVATLSRLLIESGHDVVVAAPLAGANAPRTYVHDGVSVYRYPIPSEPTRDEAQGRVSARGSELFRAWIREIKPDVVHFHSIVTGLGVLEMRAAKEAGAQVIFTSHASSLGYICQRGTLMRWGTVPCDGLTEIVKCSACELQHRGMPRALALLLAEEPVSVSHALGSVGTSIGTALGMPDLIAHNQAMQRELVALVDRFVVLTQAAASIVSRNGIPAGKLFVSPLGISEIPTAPKPSAQLEPTTTPVKLGYLGRFDTVKGVVELAEALRSIPASVDFSFEFRGPALTAADRAVADRVKHICADDSRIRFSPAVQASEVTGVLAGYDVLVCPSVCAEGGPTVAIEAHAAGTPVVGTRIGGLAELVDEGVNGSLVPPGDVAALANMLTTICRSPAETIDRWRGNLPAARTMSDVAEDYAGLYAGQLAVR